MSLPFAILRIQKSFNQHPCYIDYPFLSTVPRRFIEVAEFPFCATFTFVTLFQGQCHFHLSTDLLAIILLSATLWSTTRYLE